MKILPRLLLATALVSLASCNQKTATAPPDNEQEIERRVQERLADEHRAQQDQALQEKEQTLAEREQSLAEQEKEMEQERDRVAAEAKAAEEAALAVAQKAASPDDPSPVAAAQQPAGEQSYDVFYRNLQPDGEWIETDRYGYVWHPTVAVREPGWQPYTDGRWDYTDYGWTWVSNERFGWAVYHYGRWARVARLGWVWCPGDEWAPAWVSWRRDDHHVGWAALPPEARWNRQAGFGTAVETQFRIDPATYVFVETENFCAPSLRQIVLRPGQDVTIFNQTRNITYLAVVNSRIFNRGPGIDGITKWTRNPVRRLMVDRISTFGGETTVRGGRLEICAPVVRQAAAPTAKPHVSQHLTNVQIEHDRAMQKANEDHDARFKAAQQKADADRKAKETTAQQQAEATRKAGTLAEQQRRNLELERQKKADEVAKAQKALQMQAEQKARADQEAARMAKDTAAKQQAETARQQAESARKANEMAAQQQAEAARRAGELAEQQRRNVEFERQKKADDETAKVQRAQQMQAEQKARAEQEAAKKAEASRPRSDRTQDIQGKPAANGRTFPSQ